MTNKIVYSDKLVEIDDDSILVRDYYYPFGNKRVNFGNVENIIVKTPSLLSGHTVSMEPVISGHGSP